MSIYELIRAGSLIYNAYCRSQTSQPRGAAPSGTAALNDLRRQVHELGERLDKLLLVSAALWSLLQERTGLTEDELLKQVEALDLKDGIADGKITRVAAQCPQCQRMISRRHNRCLFCGAQAVLDSSMEGI